MGWGGEQIPSAFRGGGAVWNGGLGGSLPSLNLSLSLPFANAKFFLLVPFKVGRSGVSCSPCPSSLWLRHLWHIVRLCLPLLRHLQQEEEVVVPIESERERGSLTRFLSFSSVVWMGNDDDDGDGAQKTGPLKNANTHIHTRWRQLTLGGSRSISLSLSLSPPTRREWFKNHRKVSVWERGARGRSRRRQESHYECVQDSACPESYIALREYSCTFCEGEEVLGTYLVPNSWQERVRERMKFGCCPKARRSHEDSLPLSFHDP